MANSRRLGAVAACTLSLTTHVARAEDTAMTFSYEDWQDVLQSYVDDEGRVDYVGLRSDREALDRFLEELRVKGPSSTPALFPKRHERLAYYINAYNALVIEGVLDLAPDADTVWGFTGPGYGFFVRRKVDLDQKQTSLKKLEDEDIRAGFGDPRIHAALNCASVSCPRLPREPFLPASLDEQLDAAMREFVGEERNCRVDTEAGTVTLSKIFDWYRADFEDYEDRQAEGEGDLIDYINRYRSAEAQIPGDLEVEFARYDKRLNRQPR
jgi:hypothetical protein